MRRKNPQLEADKRLLQYADYEAYLDSFITKQDLCYLQNLHVCRKFSELGYRNWGETLSQDTFERRYEAVLNYVHPEFIPYVLVSEKIACPDAIHKELATRERPNRLGIMSTVIYIRHETETGHEVSGYIDYSERIENENWRSFFQGKKQIFPNSKDLGYYHWKFGKSCSNDSVNYKIFLDPYNGLRFQNRFDRKFINVNPLMHPGENTTRVRIKSNLYKHVVLFDHLVRQRV
ncbi:cilia- and flagella-associated protein 299-like [Coccinella septempunctata]|uniref:cilia- and flagella-associated protein 299-like n=1 Tax=Coccinella septempunctata TaxID=41139 RepID=UPI001D08FF7C|nr:cilia- and flagella-associated protein 299-like [Coccinella septempunctata]